MLLPDASNWKTASALDLCALHDLIWSRLPGRKGHDTKAHMLQSQFEALEEPTNRLTIDVSMSVYDIVQEILKHME